MQKRWKGLGEDKARTKTKKAKEKGAGERKEAEAEAEEAAETAVEPETNLNVGGVAAALLYASKKGYIKSETAKSAAEPPARQQIEEIRSKDFLVEDKKFEYALVRSLSSLSCRAHRSSRVRLYCYQPLLSLLISV